MGAVWCGRNIVGACPVRGSTIVRAGARRAPSPLSRLTVPRVTAKGRFSCPSDMMRSFAGVVLRRSCLRGSGGGIQCQTKQTRGERCTGAWKRGRQPWVLRVRWAKGVQARDTRIVQLFFVPSRFHGSPPCSCSGDRPRHPAVCAPETGTMKTVTAQGTGPGEPLWFRPTVWPRQYISRSHPRAEEKSG